jgi:riboflavin biosynthesis pyrimidine reductase
VLSGAGTIDPEHPGLTEDSVVLTSEQGVSRLRGRVPRSATIVAIGDTPELDLAVAVEALRAGGHELILCEGGPMLFGSLVEAGLVDELFLTISPLLAGRGTRSRPGLIEGVEFLPGRTVPGRLLSLRRSRSHLFVRYAIEASVVPR